MFSEVFFIIKSIVLTIILLMIMQIHIGGQTLEARSMHLVQNSGLLPHLQTSADALVRLAGKLGEKVSALIGDSVQVTVERGKNFAHSASESARSILKGNENSEGKTQAPQQEGIPVRDDEMPDPE